MAQPVIEVGADYAKLADYVKRFPTRLAEALNKSLAEGMERLVGAVKETAFTGTGQVTLGVRTGLLRASVSWRRHGAQGDLIAAIGVLSGPATAYARIHEEGGIIRPVNAKALAIPLKDALTPSGRPRFPGGPREAQKTHPDMFLMRRRGLPPLLVAYSKESKQRGKGRRVRGGAERQRKLYLLFVLVPKVRIPARRWLSSAVQKQIGVFEAGFDGRLARELGLAA